MNIDALFEKIQSLKITLIIIPFALLVFKLSGKFLNKIFILSNYSDFKSTLFIYMEKRFF